MTLGKKIYTLRKERNISQEKLAESINVSRQAISKWEQDLVIPDTNNIIQLCKFFNVPIEYLLYADDSDDTKNIDEKITYQTSVSKNYSKATVLYIAAGIVVISFALLCTPILKRYDLDTNGSCYTNEIHYIFDFPLSIICLIGIAFIVIGIIKVLRSKRGI